MHAALFSGSSSASAAANGSLSWAWGTTLADLSNFIHKTGHPRGKRQSPREPPPSHSGPSCSSKARQLSSLSRYISRPLSPPGSLAAQERSAPLAQVGGGDSRSCDLPGQTSDMLPMHRNDWDSSVCTFNSEAHLPTSGAGSEAGASAVTPTHLLGKVRKYEFPSSLSTTPGHCPLPAPSPPPQPWTMW